MKIGFKLTLTMTTLILVSISAITIALLLQSRNTITTYAKENTISMAQESANDIKSFLGTYWDNAQTLSRVLEQYDHIMVTQRRIFINTLIENVVRENPGIMGIFCIFEPNVLEGNDLAFLGFQGTSDEDPGRFAPYWFRDRGEIGMFVLPPDYNDPEKGYYYQMPLKTGKLIITNPQLYPVENELILMSSIAAPIIKDGRAIGVLGIDIAMKEIQAKAEANKPFPDALTSVFSNDGTVAAHFDKERLGKNMRETEGEKAGTNLNGLINAITSGEQFFYTFYNKDIKDEMDAFIVPIRISNSETPWAYSVAISRKTVLAPVYRMIFSTSIIGIVTLALAILVAILVAKNISKPIVFIARMLKDISEGEGDLTKTIPQQGNDEIADMSHYFNMTMLKTKNMIINIKKQAESLSNIGNELSSNMTETAAIINQIVMNIQSIRNRVVNQSASVTETHSTMEQITININKLNTYVDKQFFSVSQSSTAIEEVLANIQSVTKTLVKNSKNVKELYQASEVGREGLQEVAQDIREIAKESEGLLEINAVIENIASQTNLLSMNAAIEAAHAGDAGKGFAVVADEIRKLAESSSEQSKTIFDVLKKIKESIDKIIQSTDNVLNKFSSIDGAVKIVSSQEEHIRNAMEEQGAGSKQILETIGELNNLTLQVRKGSSEMLEGSKEVIQESQSLEMSTQEIEGGMNEMGTGAQQINMAVAKVNELTLRNKENIHQLVKEISNFKVD